MELVIACDGGCSFQGHTPCIATYAFVAYCEDRFLRQASGVVCRGRWANSLAAEYGAVVAALCWAVHRQEPGLSRVRILSDCDSVVERLLGRCAVHNWQGYRLLHRTAAVAAARLRRQGCEVVLERVPRRKVAAAHHLCARVYRREQGDRAKSAGGSISAFLRAASTLHL